MKRTAFWLSPAAIVIAAGPAYAVHYLSPTEARAMIFPQAEQFSENHIIFTPQQKSVLVETLGREPETRGQRVWKVYQEKIFRGFFFLDSVIGKHELIDYAVGVDSSGAVTQVEILEYRESYGWEIRNESWRKRFVGKTARDPVKLNQDIPNIGGATLSCRHVTEGIKKILVIYDRFLKENPPG